MIDTCIDGWVGVDTSFAGNYLPAVIGCDSGFREIDAEGDLRLVVWRLGCQFSPCDDVDAVGNGI